MSSNNVGHLIPKTISLLIIATNHFQHKFIGVSSQIARTASSSRVLPVSEGSLFSYN